MHYLNKQNISLFLLQFFLILGGSKLLGSGFQRLRQPTITADILAGIMLGPWLTLAIKRRVSVSITRLISEKTVLPALDTVEKNDTIRALYRAASDSTGISKNSLVRAVFERESRMSTAVEEGAAFPKWQDRRSEEPRCSIREVGPGLRLELS